MGIRVEFEEPQLVSISSEVSAEYGLMFGVQGYDIIEVEFLSDGLITSIQGQNVVKTGLKMSAIVPPQGNPIGKILFLIFVRWCLRSRQICGLNSTNNDHFNNKFKYVSMHLLWLLYVEYLAAD